VHSEGLCIVRDCACKGIVHSEGSCIVRDCACKGILHSEIVHIVTLGKGKGRVIEGEDTGCVYFGDYFRGKRYGQGFMITANNDRYSGMVELSLFISLQFLKFKF
jgi:hypothetical protein